MWLNPCFPRLHHRFQLFVASLVLSGTPCPLETLHCEAYIDAALLGCWKGKNCQRCGELHPPSCEHPTVRSKWPLGPRVARYDEVHSPQSSFASSVLAVSVNHDVGSSFGHSLIPARRAFHHRQAFPSAAEGSKVRMKKHLV